MMTLPVAHADVYTDFQGLSELRAGVRENSQEHLREVAGQFESLFIQMMLKSMRDASLGEGLMDSDHVKTFQSMFDQQIALDMGKRNGLGLADMMVRQLSRNFESGEKESAVVAPAGLQQQARVPSQQGQVTAAQPVQALRDSGRTAVDDWRPDTPEAFVKQLWPHARRAADELGTQPEVLISQAALETGWGKHMIRGSDGSNSFNLFGIKADARWQGERAVTETVEFRDGLMRRERATFRAYDSLGDSFRDYVQFLKGNPRYQDALSQAGDSAAYARELSAAGYATDPDYSGKIERIMGSQRLRDAIMNLDRFEDEPVKG